MKCQIDGCNNTHIATLDSSTPYPVQIRCNNKDCHKYCCPQHITEFNFLEPYRRYYGIDLCIDCSEYIATKYLEFIKTMENEPINAFTICKAIRFILNFIDNESIITSIAWNSISETEKSFLISLKNSAMNHAMQIPVHYPENRTIH